MSLLIKNNLFFYKKFNVDIWGLFKSSLILRLTQKEFEFLNIRVWKGVKVPKKSDWINRFFSSRSSVKSRSQKRRQYFYRLDNIEPSFVKYKRMRKSSVDIRLMRIFYVTLGRRRILKFAKRAKLRDGLFAVNYLFFLECRTVSIIYRSTLLASIFEIIRFIKKNNIGVNNKYIRFVNKRILPFSLIRFRIIFKGYVYWHLYKRLQRKALFSNIPRYMYFSYQFLFFFLTKVPKEKDLVNPFPLDIFKICGFDNSKY